MARGNNACSKPPKRTKLVQHIALLLVENCPNSLHLAVGVLFSVSSEHCIRTSADCCQVRTHIRNRLYHSDSKVQATPLTMRNWLCWTEHPRSRALSKMAIGGAKFSLNQPSSQSSAFRNLYSIPANDGFCSCLNDRPLFHQTGPAPYSFRHSMGGYRT
ncbi:hypothetical protein BDW67DRAFT_96636 [Aspergillus spinulosporus]